MTTKFKAQAAGLATHANAEVLLDVVDDGVGMTPEQLSHLFEPFNRLGNEGNAIEGSGLGLTLTRQPPLSD